MNQGQKYQASGMSNIFIPTHYSKCLQSLKHNQSVKEFGKISSIFRRFAYLHMYSGCFISDILDRELCQYDIQIARLKASTNIVKKGKKRTDWMHAVTLVSVGVCEALCGLFFGRGVFSHCLC